MSKSKRKIEEQGTSYLKEVISNIDNLREEIKSNDKSEFFDGVLLLYSDNPDKGENLVDDNIPIQVRTTSQKKKNDDKCRIKRNELIAYKKRGGVIYFKICVSDTSNKEIYYKVLLPVELNMYLNNSEIITQDSFTFKLKKLSKEKYYDLWRIAQDFSENRKKQMSQQDLNLTAYKQDLSSTYIKGSFSRETKFEDLIDNEYPVYDTVSDKGVEIPIAVNMTKIKKIIVKGNCEVKIGEKIYFNKIEKVVTKDSQELVISKCVSLNVKTGKIKIEMHGTITERLNAIDFIIEIIKNDGKCNMFNFDIKEINKLMVKNYKKMGKFYSSLKQTLKEMGIEEEFNLDLISSEELHALFTLDEYFRTGKIKVTQENGVYVIKYKLGELSATLFMEVNDGEIAIKNAYKISDVFKHDFQLTIGDLNKTYHFKNIFLLFEQEHFDCNNFNPDVLVKSIEEMKWTSNIDEIVNAIVLALINIFDKDSNKINHLLCAKKIIELIIEHQNKLVYKINLWQIKSRLRELDVSDTKEIISYLAGECSDEQKWALNVLLDLKSVADEYFSKLNKALQEELLTAPISKVNGYDVWKK